MVKLPELKATLQRIADLLSVLTIRTAKEEEDMMQQYVPQVNRCLPYSSSIIDLNFPHMQAFVSVTAVNSWEDCFKILEKDLEWGINPIMCWKDRLAGLKGLRYAVKRNIGTIDCWICESRALADLIYDAVCTSIYIFFFIFFYFFFFFYFYNN